MRELRIKGLTGRRKRGGIGKEWEEMGRTGDTNVGDPPLSAPFSSPSLSSLFAPGMKARNKNSRRPFAVPVSTWRARGRGGGREEYKTQNRRGGEAGEIGNKIIDISQ